MMTCLAVWAAMRPKACVLHVDVDQIAELGVLVDLAGLVERDLRGGREDVVDDLLLHVHVHIVVLDLDKDVVGIALFVLLIGGDRAPA